MNKKGERRGRGEGEGGEVKYCGRGAEENENKRGGGREERTAGEEGG